MSQALCAEGLRSVSPKSSFKDISENRLVFRRNRSKHDAPLKENGVEVTGVVRRSRISPSYPVKGVIELFAQLAKRIDNHYRRLRNKLIDEHNLTRGRRGWTKESVFVLNRILIAAEKPKLV